MSRHCLAIALFLALGGCQSEIGTPLDTAERFLDEQYVHMNLARAKDYCIGVARQKIEEMEHLIGDQKIDETTRLPRVSYALRETKEEGGDRVLFVFEGTIRVEDADSFTRRWLVNTRKEADGQWRVSNFQEFE